MQADAKVKFQEKGSKIEKEITKTQTIQIKCILNIFSIFMFSEVFLKFQPAKMCSIKVVLTKYGPVPNNTAGKGKRCRISSGG